jgi:hypothetical protein
VFTLDQPLKGSKAARREHLQSVEKQSGKRLPDLDLPDVPKELMYLYQWARTLIRSDSQVTYSEILAWATLTKEMPSPWEVEVLTTIDAIYHKVRHDCQT